MGFLPFPASAAWAHREAREGFEAVFFRDLGDGGHDIEGCTTAVEAGQTWIVDYLIRVDATRETRRARVTARSADGAAARSTQLDHDGAGRWLVDGTPAPQLDGCHDVDLESSAMTNALPVRRLGLPVGARADAPAVYVRARDLAVERLAQTYTRAPDEDLQQRFDYSAPAFDFACRLAYDASGLVLVYPGLAVRAA